MGEEFIRPIQIDREHEGGSLAVLAAGGTGGHVFPAEAFARELSGRGWRVVLVTDERGGAYSGAFSPNRILRIRMESLKWKNPIEPPRFFWRMCVGTLEVLRLFGKERPALVAGFGGYAAAPVLFAASLCRVAFFLHEQNAVLGKVNRLFSGGAQILACGFDRIDGLPARITDRVRVVGNPVRPDIAALHGRSFSSSGSVFRLLVTGGSQGAAVFGRVVPEALERCSASLRSRLRVCQQVCAGEAGSVRAHFSRIGVEAEVSEFFDDMAERLQKAHLVIARAGASSVSELALSGRPAILVPLPGSADGHQQANAEILSEAGAALVVEEGADIVEHLSGSVRCLSEDGVKLSGMARAAHDCARPNAAAVLADLAEQAVMFSGSG